MIKLVAIDLDGTLLNDKKEISKRNEMSLKKIHQKGIKVVLCTGRPLGAIHDYIEQLGLNEESDYTITFNGGLIIRNRDKKVLSRMVLSYSDVVFVQKMMVSLQLPLAVLDFEKVFKLPSKNQSLYQTINPKLAFSDVNLDELATKGPFSKMVVAFDAEKIDQHLEQIRAEVGEQFNVVKSRSNLLEILPKEVSKAIGLRALGKKLQIKPSEMMALGDEENDLPMLNYVKYAIAMDNAVSEVKLASLYITTSNEEDGVADAIDHFKSEF